ncbi:MAG: hypothetical protein J7M14_00460 [Planctomycetes bacterium]|nr:hypothetical protein [Planctomycetota bacterium]
MVELAVVVCIISLTASVAAPVLYRTRIAARRACCASNLRGISLAIVNYSADNKGQLMRSASWWGSSMQVSSIRRRHVDFHTTSDTHPWTWNIESINPYVRSFDHNDPRTGGLFICPASDGDYWRKSYYDALNDEDTDEVDILIPTPYAYYARVETWDDSSLQNGAGADLTTDDLQADRLLMSDQIQLSRRSRRLYYNHGDRGPSLPSAQQPVPASSLTGVNHLYGDGRVEWKNIDEIHPETIAETFSYYGGFVGTSGASDLFFY